MLLSKYRGRKKDEFFLKRCLAVFFLTIFTCLSTVGYWAINDPGAANALIYTSFSMGENLGVKLHLFSKDSSVRQPSIRSVDFLADENNSVPSELGTIEVGLPPADLCKDKVCPETRLPDIRGLIDVCLDETSIQQVENFLLQNSSNTEEINKIASIANEKLKLLQYSKYYGEASHDIGLNYTFDKYTYLPGGHWVPTECQPKWKVAIIIPFRDREEHLPILLKHLVPMLMRQRLEFAFFVINQSNQESFNRAMLFNVGFLESLKFYQWDCFLFHDVDHIPENDRNYYGCELMPRHFVRGLDKYGYRLPYNEFFGGVSGLTRQHMQLINGFSNSFWGWGGEDDDLWNRVSFSGYTVSRPMGNVGYYKSIQHHHKGTRMNLGRFRLLWKSKERNAFDGLSNCDYGLPKVEIHPLYFNISVDIHAVEVEVPE